MIVISLREKNVEKKGIKQPLQLPFLTDDISHWFRIPLPDLKTVEVLGNPFPFLLIEKLLMLVNKHNLFHTE